MRIALILTMIPVAILAIVFFTRLRFKAFLEYTSRPLCFVAGISTFGGRLGARFRTSEAQLKQIFARLLGMTSPGPDASHITRLNEVLIPIKRHLEVLTQKLPHAERSFSRLCDALRIERFRTQAIIGTDNPVLTGECTGAAWAIAGLLVAIARRSGRFAAGEPRFSISPSFNSASVLVRVQVEASAPLWLFLLSWFMYRRALNNPPRP